MSVQSEIDRISAAKANLKTAIENGGVSVSASAHLDTYPSLVDAITEQINETLDAINGETVSGSTSGKLAKLEETKSAMKTAINGSGNTVGDKFADYPPAVTNGRAGIAAAITEKGVQTPADAPFDVLEANVRAIESGRMEEYTILVDMVESSYIELPIADIDSRGFSLFFGLRDSAPPMMENDFNIVGGGILSIRKKKSVSLSEADVFFFQARPNYNMGGVAIAMKGSDAGLVARQLSGKPILYCENVQFLGVTNGDTSYVGCYRLILE